MSRHEKFQFHIQEYFLAKDVKKAKPIKTSYTSSKRLKKGK